MFQRALFQYRGSLSGTPGRVSTRALCRDSRKRRLLMFDTELRRQKERNGFCLEKAIVTVIGHLGEQRQLLMNNLSSTYHDCLKHISRQKTEGTALVLIESDLSTELLPVHAIVNGSSTLRPLSFTDYDYAEEVNKAYWRSCAFVLGAIAETAFRAEVSLAGALPPICESGRFGYVASIDDLHDWKPSKNELGVLTRTGLRNYVDAGLPFTPLTLDRQIAAEIFEDNPVKKERILKGDEEQVTLYKMGDHVDITDGPLVASTRQIGRFAVTNVESRAGSFYFYGVSVPYSQRCSSFSWDLLMDASRQSDTVLSESIY